MSTKAEYREAGEQYHNETAMERLDRAERLLGKICDLRKADLGQVSLISNQGQALDGISLLANYNAIADKVIKYFDKWK